MRVPLDTAINFLIVLLLVPQPEDESAPNIAWLTSNYNDVPCMRLYIVALQPVEYGIACVKIYDKGSAAW